ncbi:MAG: transcription-repair coupling factor [Proteobacteria bacterium]|nr:transcription-repair coupling factor [Pseudomonadota bacterium]
MTSEGSSFSLTASLARETASLADLVAAFEAGGRVDALGLPLGAAALALARLGERGRPLLVVTPDTESASRLMANLRFFLGEEEATRALSYPASEVSPFVDVTTDRRASMQRLAVLFHLAHARPWRLIVASTEAVARKVMPPQALRYRSLCVETGDEIDRDRLLAALADGGFVRVPVVEDPGTYAVRGAVVDVFPPHERYPIRLELDDELVCSLKRFDPDTQRKVVAQLNAEQDVSLWVYPVREAIVSESTTLEDVKRRLGELCDDVNMPTRQRSQLIEDVLCGRAFLNGERFVPAFQPRLVSLFDHLPDDVPRVIIDPSAVARSSRAELGRAKRDHDAALANQEPAYPVAAHYLNEQGIADGLTASTTLVLHRLLVAGTPDAVQEGPLGWLETAAPQDAMDLGAQAQTELRALAGAAPKASARRHEPLAPLAERARVWLDEGFRVLFAARSQTQAQRLLSVLKTYGVPVPAAPRPSYEALPKNWLPRQLELLARPLKDGFAWPSQGLICVSEEDVFGSRGLERRTKRDDRDSRSRRRAFLEDLRQLAPGDLVVHVTHGIGRYLGLERKHMPLSQGDRLHGLKPVSVEVLVVQYAGGDKLYLPVTRLNQIQKFSGSEASKAKLDRLGGQTFNRAKSRVRGAIRRLADDLLKLYAERSARTRPPLPAPDSIYTEFEAAFPFEETPDQARAIDDVMNDLDTPEPMDRVVCGDVGFGKTEVALRAAFRVAMNGRQVAVLCPTTVLAQQHFMTFRERFAPYPLELDVLSRFVQKRQQNELVRRIKDGTCDVVIGTHRLLSRDVHFRKLGLLVVDEEQRFGVAHKERIKTLRKEVDVLTLSATPIPRTLQMAVGGIRNLSLITTPPADRRAVRTFATRWDEGVIREAIERELSRGGQVFFVHNRIEGLYERAARLQEMLPRVRFAIAHGKLKESVLERVVTDFVQGRYDVLCSTAIVENGLDIPRANTMLIDRSDLFGLAQLYQLRGRVGRAKERAYCYLIAPAPNRMTDEARTRIETLQRFSELGSGFQVSSLDMELRGAGDLLGAEQSGNIASVGFELYVRMLEEAVAELRGEARIHEVDPELTLDADAYLPEDYIGDVGVRLSLYKRLADASSEGAITEMAAEMEDRFGPPPLPAQQLVRSMALRPLLRRLRVVGCEAYRRRVTLHFRHDTPLDRHQIASLTTSPQWRLTPDMKLTRRFDEAIDRGAIEGAEHVLHELLRLTSSAHAE